MVLQAPGSSFISIQIGSSPKLDPSPSPIHLLLRFLPFHVLSNLEVIILGIFFNIQPKILKSLSYLTWFSVLISIFFAIITIFGVSCKRVIWNSSQSVSATLHFKWLLHCKEPYCVGKGCHLSKMFFQFNQWPAKFDSFFSFLCGEKVYYCEVCHRV